MSKALPAIAGGLALCLFTTLFGAEPASTSEPDATTNSAAANTATPTNAVAPAAVPSPETNAPVAATNSQAEVNARANGFEQFEMIADRNIFNASRRPHTKSGRDTPPPPRPKVDVIALAGTLKYDQGDFAFFDSNATEFRKAAKVGDDIAGYQLKEIEQSHVALVRSNEVTQLNVGEQLRREGNGDWKITSGESFGSASFAGPGNQPDGKPEAGGESSDLKTKNSTSASEGPSEALKRLLEKVRKEKSK